MKPLNYDDNGCNNISSNCVIWQGPDIKCINLCKGDTVSDVIYKLATELCEILDILNIDSYALDCFAGTNEPATFKELIQLIITQLCDIPAVINNINNRINTSTSGACPDCVLNLPTCFQYVNGFGDTVTEAQLTDYVTSIGNRVCQLIVEINTIQIAVADNTARITILENTPPPVYIPPTVTPTCVLPSVPTQMNDVLSALETQFCQLRSATGGPVDIYINVAKQCAGLNSDASLTSSSITMSSIPGWTSSVSNMAEAFGNMWLTICDLRTAVRNIQLNCCPSGCDGISITLLAVLDGTNLTIYVNGTIPTNFVQCSGTTQIKISDTSGTSSIVTFDLQSYLNSFAGFTVNLASTPLNTALDLTVEIEPCLSDPNTGTVCKSCLSYTIISTANCPEVTLTAESTAIDYSFTSLAGNYTYTIELYDNTYGTLLQTQTQAAGSTVPVTGSFTTLTSSTQYHIRVSVVPTACLECPPTVCPFNTTTTLPPIIL
jgi:hypothetical protein